jgi:hypothetical protein
MADPNATTAAPAATAAMCGRVRQPGRDYPRAPPPL